MVELEPVGAPSADKDGPGRPRQRSITADDSGMGDMLRFDAERLRILVERHLLHTGSARARELLDNWDNALTSFVKVMPKRLQARAAAGARSRGGQSRRRRR